jgi:predicted MFS family arabinose efflux permease
MDQTGAVIGPLLMVVSVARLHHFAPAFLRLAVPAILALLAMIVAYMVDPSRAEPPQPKPTKDLPRVFWMYVIGAGVLAFGFIDFPVLSFHFQNTNIVRPEVIPLLYAGAMGVVGVTALIFGKLFDRYGIGMLAIGIMISVFSVPLGFLGGPIGISIAVACWATGLGVQDATLRAGIASVVSMNKRGNAFGIFNAVYGIAWFLGSSIMGILYDHSIYGLVAFGVAAQLTAAVIFFRLRRPLATAPVAS